MEKDIPFRDNQNKTDVAMLISGQNKIQDKKYYQR